MSYFDLLIEKNYIYYTITDAFFASVIVNK